MASKRSSSSVSDNEPSFVSDDSGDEYDMTYYQEEKDRRERIEKRRLEKESERLDVYTAKISKQLDECGDCLKGKLGWASSFRVAEPACTQFPVKRDPPVVHKHTAVVQKPPKHFENERPFEVQVRSGNTNDLVIDFPKEPEPEPVMCHYAKAGKYCKFENRCKFVHPQQPQKTKKIWLCRNVDNCRFGNRCLFAHTVEEVANAVTPCTYQQCRRIKVVNNTYMNTTADSKCLKLHKNESIENFINRVK